MPFYSPSVRARASRDAAPGLCAAKNTGGTHRDKRRKHTPDCAAGTALSDCGKGLAADTSKPADAHDARHGSC